MTSPLNRLKCLCLGHKGDVWADAYKQINPGCHDACTLLFSLPNGNLPRTFTRGHVCRRCGTIYCDPPNWTGATGNP
jgi:hypothetical protein